MSSRKSTTKDSRVAISDTTHRVNYFDPMNFFKQLSACKPISFDQIDKIEGDGVYAITYHGDHPRYEKLANANLQSQIPFPLYVGRAISSKKRPEHLPRRAMAERLRRHYLTLGAVNDLKVRDFRVYYLALPPDFIETAENSLLRALAPLWNHVITGFGNKDPGKGRRKQKMSSFDLLHPGRKFARKLKPSDITLNELETRIQEHMRRWIDEVVFTLDPGTYRALHAVNKAA